MALLRSCFLMVLWIVVNATVGANGCGGSYSRPSGIITSPRYPHSYRNNLRCTYIIRLSRNARVAVRFTDFDTESCCDHLTIGGTRYSGGSKPPPYTSPNSSLTFTFYSDYSVTRSGWRLEYGTNGAWASWNSWGSCSKNCGSGRSYRHRTCSNPRPAGIGQSCSGQSSQSKSCNTHICSVNGGWSQWSSWDSCTKTCGSGARGRRRSCNNPRPVGNGQTCSGQSTQTGSCNTQVCSVNGGWSQWTPWGSCTKTCGSGTSGRQRSCTSPRPVGNGRTCSGQSTQSRSCNTQVCSVDGGWSQWSSWGSCTKTCGSGTSGRQRSCTNPRPVGNGRTCPGQSTQSRPCNTQVCSVNGGWSQWSSWGSCTKTCGSGTRGRRRSCNNPRPVGNGRTCSGQSTQTGSCNTQVCSVNGGWSQWTPWGSCTKTCGSGTSGRQRSCTNPRPVGNGRSCSGQSTQSRSCNTQVCSVNGGWSQWSSWGSCTKTCGSGTSGRQRSCTNPRPVGNGRTCSGQSTQSRSCNTQVCSVDGGWSRWSGWGACSVSCGDGSRLRRRQCSNPSPAGNGRTCVGETTMTGRCNLISCPIDGKWSVWTTWTLCSASCGGGDQIRHRNCSNPFPAFGGQDCSGRSQENQNCNTFNCPIDGQWSLWSNWFTCSLSCGGGVGFRYRNCSDPIPAFGGRHCSGTNLENRTCNIFECPIDGRWSLWSNWTTCSTSCGGGHTTRTRSCNDPAPAFGGLNCFGVSLQNQTCNIFNCPIDGQWSLWSNWSRCSTSCGGGAQNRNRSCSNPPPAFGGQNCSGKSLENQACNTFNCPIDGQWSLWSNWSRCSTSCGGGAQNRNRNCSNPSPAFGGQNCSGKSLENQACNTFNCPIDGQWSLWSNWSICSLSCGGGAQNRIRGCCNPSPAFGGLNCPGMNLENRTCNTLECPIDGKWSLWSNWTTCSTSCGGGHTSRTRSCSNPSPAFGGLNCPGMNLINRTCNTFECPIDGRWSFWSNWTTCSTSCGGGHTTRTRSCSNPTPAFGGLSCSGVSLQNQTCNEFNCPIDGQWSLWSNWSICSLSCGGGAQNRNRSCSNPSPAFGGQNCSGINLENRTCNTLECPIDGRWSLWSNWTTCSTSCGGGHTTRARSCSDPTPAFGGLNCSGTSLENRTCNTFECPIDGRWSLWSNWTTCSTSCGGGHTTRTRSCSNPTPAFGGLNCSGVSLQNQTCNEFNCPIDGQWSLWSNWSICSLSCGGGAQNRNRSCSNPSPAFGGQNCSGINLENRTCNTLECPIDGKWSLWSNWTTCSTSCGGGHTTRARSCCDPTPAFGGLNCSGTNLENRTCNTFECPIDGRWSLWSNWTICSTSCGGGHTTRTRSCSRPAFGGLNCSGMDIENRTCNDFNCPIDGNWSPWSIWSTCSQACGGGEQSRSRSCNNPIPAFGGENCVGSKHENQTCNELNCPVNGQWSFWSSWDTCSLSCGGGNQVRSRTCSNPLPAFGGLNCSGNTQENRTCNEVNCPVNGQWSSWLPWSSCTMSCSGGIQSRNRSCSNPSPAYNGRSCVGLTKTYRACNNHTCPVNGKWANWSPWGVCSVTCSNGTSRRSRTCSNPAPIAGGEFCNGVDNETKLCTERCGWSTWTSWSKCSSSCNDGSQSRNRTCFKGSCIGREDDTRVCGGWATCRVWSVWSAWSKCSTTCQQTRKRACINPTTNDCGENGTERKPCFHSKCEPTLKDGNTVVAASTAGREFMDLLYIILPIGGAVVVVIIVLVVVVVIRKRRRRQQAQIDAPNMNDMPLFETKSTSLTEED